MISQRGSANPRGGANLLFGIIFAEICMKMKKKQLNSEGAHVPRAPGSATAMLVNFFERPNWSEIMINIPEPLHASYITIRSRFGFVQILLRQESDKK